MSVGIPEVKLRRRHPANYRWFRCFGTVKIVASYPTVAKALASFQQIRQTHSESDVRRVKIATVSRTRTPQADHRPLVLASPEENDVSGRIAIREFQSDHAGVEHPRRFGVRHRKVCLIEMHNVEN